MTHLLRPDHVHATALKVLVVFIGHALDQTLRLGKVYVDSLVVGDRVAHSAKTPLSPFSQFFRPAHIILVYLGLRRIRIFFLGYYLNVKCILHIEIYITIFFREKKKTLRQRPGTYSFSPSHLKKKKCIHISSGYFTRHLS